MAEFQHFVYSEFLPVLLSEQDIQRHDLKCPKNSVYDSNSDPSTRNEFASAAMRFGHSLGSAIRL